MCAASDKHILGSTLFITMLGRMYQSYLLHYFKIMDFKKSPIFKTSTNWIYSSFKNGKRFPLQIMCLNSYKGFPSIILLKNFFSFIKIWKPAKIWKNSIPRVFFLPFFHKSIFHESKSFTTKRRIEKVFDSVHIRAQRTMDSRALLYSI